MKEWTEKDYEGCDTPRTAGMLVQRAMDPRSTAPFVEFTRGLEREVNELRKALEKCVAELKALTTELSPRFHGATLAEAIRKARGICQACGGTGWLHGAQDWTPSRMSNGTPYRSVRCDCGAAS